MFTRFLTALTLLTLAFGPAAVAANPAAQPAAKPQAGSAKPKTIRVPNGPTIYNLRGFPVAQLKQNVSPKFFKSLAISPVAAWVVTQAPIHKGAQPKIIRSDAGGAFDQLAIEMAKGWSMVGYNTVESRTYAPKLQTHLLIYKIADGMMAVNFSYSDDAQNAGLQHSDVTIATLKDGAWRKVGGTKYDRQYGIDPSSH